MYAADILNLRHRNFVLWLPGLDLSPRDQPLLQLLQRGSDKLSIVPYVYFTEVPGKPGLWVVDIKALSAYADGTYLYFYRAGRLGDQSFTDPLAFTVDYDNDLGVRLHPAVHFPLAVIKISKGQLLACDPDGTDYSRAKVPDHAKLSPNNHLVIYELPTSWAKGGFDAAGVEIDKGTFADVEALFDSDAPGQRFKSIAGIHRGAILADLGINAIELLPAADSKAKGEWGYATANYFAPDADLGPPSTLVSLVDAIHGRGVRLITDVVMAFGHDPYGEYDFAQFHINPDDEPENPDSYQSHASNQKRVDWGGKLWRYSQQTETYDPESGETKTICPAWAFHKCHLTRWMTDFAVGGLRLDSLNNVGNWDFVHSYTEKAWELYNDRYGGKADPSKFLVIGEELSMPLDMISRGCVNALWNEPWQKRLRCTILGESCNGDNFEWTVRKLADCTLDGFDDGSQAVNYITSHDIEGFRKERLYNFLTSSGIWDVQRRAQLAFVLLLTAVGIPMIFAGEEFADQMDISTDMGKKQMDPVNYARKDDGGWREALFEYVARLVKFRTTCPALGQDDTEFFHVDGSRGGKILAWRRGQLGRGPVVVVVANFTDEPTPGEEYVVPNWPDRNVAGWREVTQNREVPSEWVGREPLMAWEAKVYTYWKE